MEKIKINFLKKVSIVATGILLLVYAFGFVSWNIYLDRYNFFEHNILQTRFLATGLLCSLFLVVILFFIGLLWFLVLLFSRLAKKYLPKFIIKVTGVFKKIKNGVRKFFSPCPKVLSISLFILLSVFLFFTITYSFVKFIFLKVPQYLGGANPMVTGLLIKEEYANYLSNFNISLAKNADRLSVETDPLCVLYQNNELILIGVGEFDKGLSNYVPRRVLVLKTENLEGHNKRLKLSEAEKEICAGFLDWDFNSFYSSSGE